jgi:geranylgeranyl diphosphate synthase, type II
MNSELRRFFDTVLPRVDAALNELLPAPSVAPAQIHEAMRYSTFAGGKRLRPALCVAGHALFQSDWQPVLPVAAALEMIHTYSLIHDDLPAMDNDDFRRGIPSCHRKFGEAVAILAGDALLTLGFETLSRCNGFPADRLLPAIRTIAEAAGTRSGMIAGQVFDLEAEHRPVLEVDVERIHRSKTAALITASVSVGARLGGASDAELEAITAFGSRIGLAFQIVDDVLDETSSIETLGKTGGKDRHQHKATYPALFGVEQSRALAADLTRQGGSALEGFGERARLLLAIADYLETRSH